MAFRSLTRSLVSAAALVALGCALLLLSRPGPVSAAPGDIGPGALVTPKGICPLKNTEVKARISGPLARVTVIQQFENPFQEKIEAVYTFPLPPDSAVDDMTMRIGDRTIRGLIKPREEARKIYDDARRAGKVASLLDQERPNIFTQAVANIMPGAKVSIEISYVETMPYEGGSYEFSFPMVVGPRYIPGAPTGQQAGGFAPDTDQVPDGSRITPQVTPEGTRAGHDISVEVAIDAGVPISSVASKTHDVSVERPGSSSALVRLRDKAAIPNKDFLLRYAVAGKGVGDAVLTHRRGGNGYLTLLLQPPERAAEADITPKELVFVLDTSGSMSGFPLDKAREAMRAALANLRHSDTFNLITFSGDTRVLFPRPVPATAENLRIAREFLDSRWSGGGTEMMKAIRAALAPSGEENHVRVVCFMTDGFVGNEDAIINEIRQSPDARIFSFGIGSAPNRYLLDNMARYGRGDVEYVGLKDDGSAAARRFEERVRTPLLTDISIDWGGLPVTEVYPAAIPDLFAAKPLTLAARFSGAASGTIRLYGKQNGREFSRSIRVNLPKSDAGDPVLATLWARRKVADLSIAGPPDSNRQQITQLGLEYRLMTAYTSFVAVEEKVVTEGGEPRRVEVPVEMPEGVSYEGVFGEASKVAGAMGGAMGGAMNRAMAMPMRMLVADAVVVTAGAATLPAPTPLEIKNSPPRLDPVVAALIRRVQAGGRPAVEEAKFVFGDEAYLKITLSDMSDAALLELRKAGFTVTQRSGNVISGHAPLAKVEAISKLAFVTWMAPR